MKIKFICIFFLFCSGSYVLAQTRQKILLLGDSHMAGAMGTPLEQELKIYGGEVKRVAVVNGRMDHWASEDPCEEGKGLTRYCNDENSISPALRGKNKIEGLRKQISEFQPDITIIGLGTNDSNGYCRPKSRATAMENASDLLKQVPNLKKCIWIGPPQYNYNSGYHLSNCANRSDFDGFVDTLKEKVLSLGCKFVDSRKIAARQNRSANQIESVIACSKSQTSPPLAPTSLHFDTNDGAYWGKCVKLCIDRLREQNTPVPFDCFQSSSSNNTPIPHPANEGDAT